MSVNNNYPYAPNNPSLTENYLKRLVQSLNFALDGKINATGEFTLTASATSTSVNNNKVNVNSVILCIPQTASAALDFASGSFYVVSGDKTFTVNHDSDPATTRTFRYVVFG